MPPIKQCARTDVRHARIFLASIALLIAVAATASTACRGASPDVVVDGLTAPRGLTLASDGAVLMAEGGGARILRLAADGSIEALVTGLPVTHDAGPAGNTTAGVSAVVEWPGGPPGRLAFVVGEFRGGRFARLYGVVPGAEPEGITPPSEPLEPGGLVNPYDLLMLDGEFIVSDPGANALVRVTADGRVLPYAEFADLEGILPDRTVEVVPTGMTLAPDGSILVASLTGYPYPPGAASVYRVRDGDGDGDALDPGEVEMAATGFRTATDVAVAPDGSLLVTEYSTDMSALIEEHGGVDEAAAVPGRLVRWRDGEVEILAEVISPTALVVHGGRVLVAEEFPGRIVAVDLPAGG